MLKLFVFSLKKLFKIDSVLFIRSNIMIKKKALLPFFKLSFEQLEFIYFWQNLPKLFVLFISEEADLTKVFNIFNVLELFSSKNVKRDIVPEVHFSNFIQIVEHEIVIPFHQDSTYLTQIFPNKVTLTNMNNFHFELKLVKNSRVWI